MIFTWETRNYIGYIGKKHKKMAPGVIALLDFDFLGDFRRFSRRFSQKFRRFFFFKRSQYIDYKILYDENVDINCWTYPTFFLNKMFYVISSATIQILYTYYALCNVRAYVTNNHPILINTRVNQLSSSTRYISLHSKNDV